MLRKFFVIGLLLVLAQTVPAQSNDTFTVGSYNVENWNSIERNKKLNQPKPLAEREAVVAVITAVHPDVLGIQEMGNTNDLAELLTMLAAKGLHYPHWEHVQAHDQDRHVCLLSRFPIVQRNSRVDYTYSIGEKSYSIGRGILDVVIQVNDHYSFRAVVVHLKSKRTTEDGDQAVMRLEEAKLLRAHLGKALTQDPQLNLIALGDFNDSLDTTTLKTIIGDAPFNFFPLPCKSEKGYENTHFWARQKEWSRIDYLLTSPGLSPEFITGSAKLHESPEAGKASDHRLISASFCEHEVAAPAKP
ncbi:MAG: endonuclease/exonuclease/phosphatase family protein [Verrucomicrobiota bacterium]